MGHFHFSIFDQMVLKNSLLSFGIFLVLQVVFFRFLKPEQVLKNLMGFLVLCGATNIILNIIDSVRYENAGMLELIVCFGISFVVYGLLSFHYAVCIFGPYESSIRLRLLRELYHRHPNGVSMSELLQSYNGSVILKRRLSRLLASGELVYNGNAYRATAKRGFFHISDAVADHLRNLVGSQQDMS